MSASTTNTTMTLAKMRDMAATATAKAKAKMAAFREHAEEAIGHGVQMAEVSGTAFGFGYLHSRYGENGELKVVGVPVDLAASLALHGVAFLGGLGKYTEHGHNLGDGALASYAYRFGAQLGVVALKSAQQPQATVRGIPSHGAAYEMGGGGHEMNGAGGRAYVVEQG